MTFVNCVFKKDLQLWALEPILKNGRNLLTFFPQHSFFQNFEKISVRMN
jgi:hypothetical protein